MFASTLAGSGCSSFRHTGGNDLRNYFPIAVWYDAPAGAGAAAVIDDDLKTIAELGFNTVFLRPGQPGGHPSVLKTAALYGLSVAVPDPGSAHYVRTGEFPVGRPSLRSLAGRTRRTAGTIVQLGEASTAEQADRLRQLARRHHRANDAPWTFATVVRGDGGGFDDLGVTFNADSTRSSSSDSVAVLCVKRTHDRRGIDTVDWLRAYHDALTAGQTRGVILDGFRASAGACDGIVDDTGQLPLRRTARIKRLTQRIRSWGPKLRGTTPSPLDADADGEDSIDMVLFARGNRRFVLLVNRSLSDFKHSPVSLALPAGFRPARRCVSVPADTHVVAGDVHRVRRGRVTLDTNLSPGDACLYEVF